MDSVPDGGWLDGCLNTLAGLESLRRIAAQGTPPPVTVRLVDWADEEGSRFGRSLLGSSACGGSLDPEEVRGRRDRDGVLLSDALREHGVELDRMHESRSQLDSAAAYLELHIEQGPVLEGLDLPLGAVLGTFGVERHLIRFSGQTAHSGSTPMADRRDAFAGAARFALEVHEHTRQTGQGAVSTTGSVVTKPGIVTAVPGECEITLDQRHLDAGVLAGELAAARASSERIAEEERLDLEWEELWRIGAIPFDERLIELADEAITEVAGASHKLPSGPLHDAAAVALAEVPTVMLFAQSLRGLSHTKEEDTKLGAHRALGRRARSPRKQGDRPDRLRLAPASLPQVHRARLPLALDPVDHPRAPVDPRRTVLRTHLQWLSPHGRRARSLVPRRPREPR